jgi:hypothetical protein
MLKLFFQWYFLDIPANIKKIWGNYLWFFWRDFSIGRLAREFFAPWKGMTFKREKCSFDPGDALSAAMMNVFSSGIGATARLFFIVIGLAMELLAVIGGVAAYIVWILFIPAIPFFLVKGISLLL